MSAAALKANGRIYGLVRKIDRNTRAVAKVVSAAEYLGTRGTEDLSALNTALYDLLGERRKLRAALERAVEEERTRA